MHKINQNTNDLANKLRCGYSALLTNDIIAYIEDVSIKVEKLPKESIISANKIIENLLFQYQNKDWLGAADTIQFELNTLLFNSGGDFHD